MDDNTLLEIIEASFESARLLPVEQATRSLINRKKSSNWVLKLSHSLQKHYPSSRDFHVLARPIPNKAFGLNELLYDIVVCKTETIDTFVYVKQVIWEIESEFESNSRELIKDFNKLVLGSAENKLFIAPHRGNLDAKREKLTPAAEACSGRVFVAFIAPPNTWQEASNASLWKWSGNEWLEIQRASR